MRDVFLCMAGIQIHNECDPNRVTNEQNCSHFKIQNDTKQNKAQRSEIELYSQHVVCSIDIFSSLFAFPPILWIRLNRSHISCTLNIFLSLNRREQTRIYEYLKISSAFLHFVIKTRHFAATIVCLCVRGALMLEIFMIIHLNVHLSLVAISLSLHFFFSLLLAHHINYSDIFQI